MFATRRVRRHQGSVPRRPPADVEGTAHEIDGDPPRLP
jgi:hypothetical protein